jgi:tetratricopeptide (TPR) repeat protein
VELLIDLWHLWRLAFVNLIQHRGPPSFKVQSEVRLTTEPQRADMLLLRRIGAERRDHEARALTSGASFGALATAWLFQVMLAVALPGCSTPPPSPPVAAKSPPTPAVCATCATSLEPALDLPKGGGEKEKQDVAGRSPDDAAGEIAALIDRATLDLRDGKRAPARAALLSALERSRAIAHIEHQARSLEGLGLIERDEGNPAAARERWTEALALYRSLQMANTIDALTKRLASLAAFEKAAEAWAAHPALLAAGGVLITAVEPDDQAARVGLAPGDILIRHGLNRLDTPDTYRASIASTPTARTVPLEVLRGPKKLTVRVFGGSLGITMDNLPPPPPASLATSIH